MHSCSIHACDNALSLKNNKYINSKCVVAFKRNFKNSAHLFQRAVDATHDKICDRHYNYAESRTKKTKRKRRSVKPPFQEASLSIFDETDIVHMKSCSHEIVSKECVSCLMKMVQKCVSKRKKFEVLTHRRKLHYYSQAKAIVDFMLDNADYELYVDGYNENKKVKKVTVKASAAMIIVGPRMSQRKYNKTKKILQKQRVLVPMQALFQYGYSHMLFSKYKTQCPSKTFQHRLVFSSLLSFFSQ